MSLPKFTIPSKEVDLGEGNTILVHGLSRSDMHKMAQFSDTEQAEAFMVSKATGESEKDATAWLAETPVGVVDKLLTAVMELSAADEGAQKSS